MAYRRKQSFEPADKVAGTYFKHTVKALMPPYGKTKGIMTDTKILDSTTLWTSEWLTRPSIAMSEWSSSIYSNLRNMVESRNKDILLPIICAHILPGATCRGHMIGYKTRAIDISQLTMT